MKSKMYHAGITLYKSTLLSIETFLSTLRSFSTVFLLYILSFFCVPDIELQFLPAYSLSLETRDFPPENPVGGNKLKRASPHPKEMKRLQFL